MMLSDIESELKSTSIPTQIRTLENDVVSICPYGQLDMITTHVFQAAYLKILESGYIRVVIDMSHVSYASSTGIGMLIQLLKETLKRKGKLILVHVAPGVFNVISLLGFTSFLVIRDSVEDALKEMV